MDRLEERTAQCETVADVLALLEEYSGQYSSWQIFLTDLLDGSGLSYHRFAALCGISKNTLKKWCTQGGAPRSRDTFLKVAFGAAMDPEAAGSMLSRYGGYGGLNPRDPFDAVCIFCLRRRCAGDTRFDYGATEALYRRLRPGPGEDGAASSSTTQLMARLLTIDTEAEFEAFFRQYGPDLCGRKLKLERFLEDFLTVRRLEAGRDGCRASLHSLQLPPEVEKQLSQLKRHGVVPRRRSLIALGLRLDMTLEELNTMLRFAGMDALCVRDRLECVLIYALQQLTLTHPELALGNATALLAVTRDAATRRRCADLAQEYWRACYRSDENGEVESVAAYVREILDQLDLEEAEELLPLL